MRPECIALLTACLLLTFSPALAQVEGNFWAGGGIRVGPSTTTCDGSITGAVRWSSGNLCMEFCNGSAWDCIGDSGGCDATPAPFEFTDLSTAALSTLTTSDILLLNGLDSGCSSTIGVSGDGSPEYRVCSTSNCSSEVQTWTSGNTNYSLFGRYVQVRTTSASTAGVASNVTLNAGNVTNVWTVTTGSTGPCGASPVPGDVCSDGSVYAGLSPDGNRHMYVTRCDEGQSWSGSACTGTRTTACFGDCSSSHDSLPVGSISGKTNTATLVAMTGADTPMQTAHLCNDSTAHGQTDWYLPATEELGVIYENLVDAIPNDNSPDPIAPGFSTAMYASSGFMWTGIIHSRPFDTGIGNWTQQNDNFYPIRCARRE